MARQNLAPIADTDAGIQTTLTFDELQRISQARKASKAPATLKAYLADWHGYAAYCALHSRAPFPATAESLSAYVTFLGALKPGARLVAQWQERTRFALRSGRKEGQRPAPPLEASSIARAVSGIRYVHSVIGQQTGAQPLADAFDDIGFRETLAGVLRTLARTPPRPRIDGASRHGKHERKGAITVEQLELMVAALDTSTLTGLRDRALLCLGYASGLRRAELAGLRVRDLKLAGRSRFMTLTLPYSKTNQTGEEEPVTVPRLPEEMAHLCPVRTAQSWKVAARLRPADPLFMRVRRVRPDRAHPTGECAGDLDGARMAMAPATVKDIIKRTLAAAALSDVDPEDFGGHSLRSGIATAMSEAGQEASRIQAHLRHKNINTTQRYIRRSNARLADAVASAYMKE